MPKITLENTQKCMITLHVAGDAVRSVSIPGARPDADQKLVNGVAEVDAEIVAAARKSSSVVKHYFTEGWLREVKSSAPEPKAA